MYLCFPPRCLHDVDITLAFSTEVRMFTAQSGWMEPRLTLTSHPDISCCRWYEIQPGGESAPVISGPRTRLLGPILVIEAVTPEDAGLYRCSASNAGGEASAELRLVVATPLHVEVTPPLLSVHLGGSAEFRCIETSQHSMQSAPSLSIMWLKDGRPLPGSTRSTGDRLLISDIGREDRGMYQCFVRRAEGETAQAAAELQLGGESLITLASCLRRTVSGFRSCD